SALVAVTLTFVIAVRRAPIALASGVIGSLALSALLLFLLPNHAREWKFRLSEHTANDALHATVVESFCGERAIDMPLLGATSHVCAFPYPDGTEVSFDRGSVGLVWTDRQ